MPKGKLVLKSSTEPGKVEVAGYFAGVKTGDAMTIGEELHLEISYPGIDNLVKFGSLLATVKGTELDAKKKKDAESAAKKGK